LAVSVKYVGEQIDNLASSNLEEGRPEVPHCDVDRVKTLKPILCFLNDKDRDIFFLFFVNNKKQKDVQEILQRSQPSLCYDIKRIRRRLRFVCYLQSVWDIFFHFIENKSDDFTPEEMDMLILMFYTSSFTMTSNIMDVSQVRVRYSYDKCLRRMEDQELWEIYEIFVVIRSNLNIIKRAYKDISGNMGEMFLPS
jgi:hypothetical protein